MPHPTDNLTSHQSRLLTGLPQPRSMGGPSESYSPQNLSARDRTQQFPNEVLVPGHGLAVPGMGALPTGPGLAALGRPASATARERSQGGSPEPGVTAHLAFFATS